MDKRRSRFTKLHVHYTKIVFQSAKSTKSTKTAKLANWLH